MKDDDELRAKAKQVLAAAEDRCMMLPSGPCKFENDASDVCEAFLALPPPLTRERVEKAAGELMDGIRGATLGFEPLDRVWLTDRLCHLLGVEGK